MNFNKVAVKNEVTSYELAMIQPVNKQTPAYFGKILKIDMNGYVASVVNEDFTTSYILIDFEDVDTITELKPVEDEIMDGDVVKGKHNRYGLVWELGNNSNAHVIWYRMTAKGLVRDITDGKDGIQLKHITKMS